MTQLGAESGTCQCPGTFSLSPGDLVAGRFLIECLIGAGGVGEVYRAVDCRLHRTVAMKMLAHHASQDPHGRQRLKREARAIAGLSHPNICALHHFDTDAGRDYLVLEYLGGDTLASRLQAGPLPAWEWQQIAQEIGGALAYAHRQGVIHRDLKPGNIMLTRERSKLVDFGLATSTRPVAPLADPVTETQEGVVAGTVSYMSPEQAEGKPVDTRKDIFSFGCVLYEMITGRKAFQGTSAISTLAAVLVREPQPIRTVAPWAPRALSPIIRKCLRKNPDHRFRTMEEVCEALRGVEVRRDLSGGLFLSAAQVPLILLSSAAGELWRRSRAMLGGNFRNTRIDMTR